jgi:hypothetical protein
MGHPPHTNDKRGEGGNSDPGDVCEQLSGESVGPTALLSPGGTLSVRWPRRVSTSPATSSHDRRRRRLRRRWGNGNSRLRLPVIERGGETLAGGLGDVGDLARRENGWSTAQGRHQISGRHDVDTVRQHLSLGRSQFGGAHDGGPPSCRAG